PPVEHPMGTGFGPSPLHDKGRTTFVREKPQVLASFAPAGAELVEGTAASAVPSFFAAPVLTERWRHLRALARHARELGKIGVGRGGSRETVLKTMRLLIIEDDHDAADYLVKA